MRKIKKYITLFLLILYISASSALCYNVPFILGTLLLLGIWASKKYSRQDNIIVFIIGYFLIVDIISCLYTGDSFRITRVFNYLYPILIAYFCLKICGRDTFRMLEKIVYVLTILSLVIFGLQLLFPTLFERLSSSFSVFLAAPYLERDPSSWYAFIYRYMPRDNYSDMVRNCGFMWEPGAFAWILVMMLFYRWLSSGIKLKDKRTIVYIIGIITTFSTAGYLALFCIVFLYAYHVRASFGKYLLIILLLMYIIPVMYNLDFISNKIESYFISNQEGSYGYHTETGTVEYNRYMFFLYALFEILHFPIGYGTHEITTPEGLPLISPNGLAKILYHWGIIGFCFFVYALYRFYQNLNRNNKWLDGVIATVAICILLFSNPAHANPLVFLLVLYPFMFKKQINESCCIV